MGMCLKEAVLWHRQQGHIVVRAHRSGKRALGRTGSTLRLHQQPHCSNPVAGNVTTLALEPVIQTFYSIRITLVSYAASSIAHVPEPLQG